MKTSNLMKITSFAVISCGLMALTGCSMGSSGGGESVRTVYREVPVEVPGEKPPGLVEYVWEEPMVDVVDVPPGLDPEGRYYRRGHQAVVEVRQGRWRNYNTGN